MTSVIWQVFKGPCRTKAPNDSRCFVSVAGNRRSTQMLCKLKQCELDDRQTVTSDRRTVRGTEAGSCFGCARKTA